MKGKKQKVIMIGTPGILREVGQLIAGTVLEDHADIEYVVGMKRPKNILTDKPGLVIIEQED